MSYLSGRRSEPAQPPRALRHVAETDVPFTAGPMVRIRFSPAESLQTLGPSRKLMRIEVERGLRHLDKGVGLRVPAASQERTVGPQPARDDPAEFQHTRSARGERIEFLLEPFSGDLRV